MTSSVELAERELLFVYGLLRAHRSNAARVLDVAGVQRLPDALARAEAPPSGALRFDGFGDRDVRGEIVVLPAEGAEHLLTRLDEYEGPEYERVRTRCRLSTGEPVGAWVYQHRASAVEADRREEMLTAACRKLEVAEYHYRQLMEWMAWTPPEALRSVPIPIQAHFEGLLAAGFSAMDQVAEFHGVKYAKQLFEDGIDLPRELHDWYDDPVIHHAGRLRNAATHRYYGKLPAGEGPTEGLRVPSFPDVGGGVPLELSAYATALLKRWQTLAGHIGCPLPPEMRLNATGSE